MKKILFFIAIFISLNAFGQNGALYQEWYLTSYKANGESYSVSEIVPHITPNLNMEQNLDFSGIAACNSYIGSFNYISGYDFLSLDSFDATLTLCDYQSHSDFETRYFSVLNDGIFSYSIIYDTDDEFLELISASGNILNYRNTPIIFSINEEVFSTISIYPNPVSNTLNISSVNSVINSITIFSLTGKKVLEVSEELNSIDVSNISKGMYFIEIFTSEGSSVKKFIKK